MSLLEVQLHHLADATLQGILPGQCYDILDLRSVSKAEADARTIRRLGSQSSDFNRTDGWLGEGYFDAAAGTIERKNEIQRWLREYLQGDDREITAAKLGFNTRMALGLAGHENIPRGVMVGRHLTCAEAGDLHIFWRETSAVAPGLTIADLSASESTKRLNAKHRDGINVEKLLDLKMTELAINAGAKLIFTEEDTAGWEGMPHNILMQRLADCGYRLLLNQTGKPVPYLTPGDYENDPTNRERNLYVKVLDPALLERGRLPRDIVIESYKTMQRFGWNIVSDYDGDESGYTQADIDGAIGAFLKELPRDKAFRLVDPGALPTPIR